MATLLRLPLSDGSTCCVVFCGSVVFMTFLDVNSFLFIDINLIDNIEGTSSWDHDKKTNTKYKKVAM